jgi:hypothetical protein
VCRPVNYCMRESVANSVLMAGAALVLLTFGTARFAAYKSKVRSFEFATVIWKLFSLKVTMISGDDVRSRASQSLS